MKLLLSPFYLVRCCSDINLYSVHWHLYKPVEPVLNDQPVLSGQLAIPQGWPFNTGLTVWQFKKRNRRKLSATVGNNSALYSAFHTCKVTILRLKAHVHPSGFARLSFFFGAVHLLSVVFWLAVISQVAIFNYAKFPQSTRGDNGPLINMKLILNGIKL